MRVEMKAMRLGKAGTALAVAAMGLAGVAAAYGQGPGQGSGGMQGGMPGMEPHRPPMEQAMGPGGDHGRWWNNPRVTEKYKLSDGQRKAMDDIYQQHRITLVDLHATLEKAEIALEPLVRADQPEESTILAQIDKVAQARAELEKANARMLLELRRQLTPEQWKLMEADRAAHWQAHGQGGPGAGEPGADGARWHHGPGHGQSGPAGGPAGAAGGSPDGAPDGQGGPPPSPQMEELEQ